MKILRYLSLILVLILTVTGVCGCMNKNSTKTNRQETDQEYIQLMQNYIQKKYSITTEVVEQIFPDRGFNTALKYNVLVLCDSNGIVFNVRAQLSTPYNFYDDYVESCTAASIQKELDIENSFATAKIYVVINNSNINEIDTSAENIVSLTFVASVIGEPNDAAVESFYKIYETLQNKGYEDIYFLVSFNDGSAEFIKAVENYKVYGKSKKEDYSGETYAQLYVTDNNLSLEEFKAEVH